MQLTSKPTVLLPHVTSLQVQHHQAGAVWGTGVPISD